MTFCMDISLVSEKDTLLNKPSSITLVNKIISCLDNGDLVIGVFLDIKKAFDTVDHKILFTVVYDNQKHLVLHVVSLKDQY